MTDVLTIIHQADNEHFPYAVALGHRRWGFTTRGEAEAFIVGWRAGLATAALAAEQQSILGDTA